MIVDAFAQSVMWVVGEVEDDYALEHCSTMERVCHFAKDANDDFFYIGCPLDIGGGVNPTSLTVGLQCRPLELCAITYALSPQPFYFSATTQPESARRPLWFHYPPSLRPIYLTYTQRPTKGSKLVLSRFRLSKAHSLSRKRSPCPFTGDYLRSLKGIPEALFPRKR
ncbi:hypothetical protein CR513_45018, partial [Mucuna pruriens]